MNLIASVPISGFFVQRTDCLPSFHPETSEQSLDFKMSYSECVESVNGVLRELGVRSTKFGDTMLCTIRENGITYSFQLRIERKSAILSKVYVANFKTLNTFTELIALRHKLFEQ